MRQCQSISLGGSHFSKDLLHSWKKKQFFLVEASKVSESTRNVFARRAYCVGETSKSMCVRPCVRTWLGRRKWSYQVQIVNFRVQKYHFEPVFGQFFRIWDFGGQRVIHVVWRSWHRGKCLQKTWLKRNVCKVQDPWAWRVGLGSTCQKPVTMSRSQSPLSGLLPGLESEIFVHCLCCYDLKIWKT